MNTGIQYICAASLLLCSTGFTSSVRHNPFDTHGILYVEDEDFAANPFSIPLSIHDFQTRYADVVVTSREPVTNIHEMGVTDTIYTFTAHQTSVSVYKSAIQDILQSAVIRNNDIALKRNIFIGMSKKAFALKFHHPNGDLPNYLEVGNAENTSVYAFSFRNDRLQEVRYLGYID